MATNSGKTHTAVTFIYPLVNYDGAKRVLFLVDRGQHDAPRPLVIQI
jgi:type I restriction enzyme R subunit